MKDREGPHSGLQCVPLSQAEKKAEKAKKRQKKWSGWQKKAEKGGKNGRVGKLLPNWETAGSVENFEFGLYRVGTLKV